MIRYKYDLKTKEYLGEHICQKSPLENDKFIFPPNTTFLKPPNLDKNETAVFKNKKWLKVIDFRGFKSFDDSGKAITISKVNEAVRLEPPKSFIRPNWVDKDWEDIATDDEVLEAKRTEFKQKRQIAYNTAGLTWDKFLCLLAEDDTIGLAEFREARQKIKESLPKPSEL